jgi:hypothetical protein
MSRQNPRRAVIACLLLALMAFAGTPVPAQSKKSTAASKSKKAPTVEGIADYSSRHFLVHTDLSAEEAQDLLKRLETMLSLIAKYWGRPAAGVIEMYVVKDLNKWPAGAITGPGLASIEGQAGVTVGRTITNGTSFVSKATVYAIADRGTPQHEAVHAYCIHAFGRTGPVWYAEGMAEMGQYWRTDDSSVNAHQVVIEYLRAAEPKSLNEIVNAEEFTGDSWQNYAWRWALCHLLANNPNYAPRFRPLGLGLLTEQADASFERVYGDMAKEITFEYRQFLKHIEKGYRADLCGWNWKTKFKTIRTGAVISVDIEARKGWQPTHVTLIKGEEYEFSAGGTWTLSKDGEPVNADGGDGARGKLVGAVLTDKLGEYELGEPFELGTFGTFTAPDGGDLYLRCNENWSEIADNKGKLAVKLKVQGKGAPLAPPKEAAEKPKAASSCDG